MSTSKQDKNNHGWYTAQQHRLHFCSRIALVNRAFTETWWQNSEKHLPFQEERVWLIPVPFLTTIINYCPCIVKRQPLFWVNPQSVVDKCWWMLITVTRHRFIDQPIKTLRHQSAEIPKCCMKLLQCLVSLVTGANKITGLRLCPSHVELVPQILEQKRDCSQSKSMYDTNLILWKKVCMHQRP